MVAPEPSDEQLMAAYVAGDRPAFAALFGRWAPRLQRIYLRAGLRSQEADDLVQQCFLQMHRARRDFRPGSKLAPWLLTIAMNLRRQLFRRRARKPEAELDDAVGEPAAPAIDPDAPMVAAIVRAALERLPDLQREVIVLHWFEDMPFPEIAAVLGASSVAVRVRAHRGYAKLRAELEAAGVTPGDIPSYGRQA